MFRNIISAFPIRYNTYSARSISTLTPNISTMKVQHIPVLSDNYSYMIMDESTKDVLVVDPVEPSKVISAINSIGGKLTTILTTHHHHDHSGGNSEMASKFPQVQIFGGDDRIPALTHKVGTGDSIDFGSKSISISVQSSPCHTTGHVLYHVNDTKLSSEPSILFTGDTLFVGGCGRFFEGTAEQMHKNLMGYIAKLPPSTHLFVGHEYTIKNLEFALSVEPENKDTIAKYKWAKERIEAKEPTIPSTVGGELSFNPFMRVNVPSLQKTVGGISEIDTMTKLRAMKDKF